MTLGNIYSFSKGSQIAGGGLSEHMVLSNQALPDCFVLAFCHQVSHC
jgi:hypothetical protein